MFSIKNELEDIFSNNDVQFSLSEFCDALEEVSNITSKNSNIIINKKSIALIELFNKLNMLDITDIKYIRCEYENEERNLSIFFINTLDIEIYNYFSKHIPNEFYAKYIGSKFKIINASIKEILSENEFWIA